MGNSGGAGGRRPLESPSLRGMGSTAGYAESGTIWLFRKDAPATWGKGRCCVCVSGGWGGRVVRYLGDYHNDGGPDQGGGDKGGEKWGFAYDLRAKWEGLLVGWQCCGRRR